MLNIPFRRFDPFRRCTKPQCNTYINTWTCPFSRRTAGHHIISQDQINMSEKGIIIYSNLRNRHGQKGKHEERNPDSVHPCTDWWPGLHHCVPVSYCSAINHRKLGRGSPAYHKMSRCCTSLFKDLILHKHSMIKTSHLDSNSVDLSFQPPHRMHVTCIMRRLQYKHTKKAYHNSRNLQNCPHIPKNKTKKHGKSDPHSVHPQVGGLHNFVLASYCNARNPLKAQPRLLMARSH